VDLSVIHRRYVPYSQAHHGGSLVDGAYVLGLFGDVATELCAGWCAGPERSASAADVLPEPVVVVRARGTVVVP
jgi:3-aminobutyryl-CoA ammonia-lyase